MAYTTINKSTEHFNTKLYTGNGSTQSITGVGFQPDLVWAKARNAANSHLWYDKIRGVHNYIRSDQTAAEGTATNTLTSFDSDGFTVGDGDNGNASGANGVAWNWKAGGAGSANTDGDINSTVSVNQTAGFSIVKWTSNDVTGATIGHGLGTVPSIVLIKNTSTAQDWIMYHKSLGNSNILKLNSTASTNAGTGSFYGTTPTNSVFTVGSDNSTRGANGNVMIAYCFAEKTGYSKFGSYTGNGGADGPFIYTGFKPAWVLFKRSSSGENWSLYDNKRLGYNPQAYGLRPNINLAESTYGAGGTAGAVDFVSNGFKIRESGTNINDGTYIYMAFAEAPLVGTNNIPCTAR